MVTLHVNYCHLSPHSPFQIILIRDYPTNVYQDVIYTFRTMYENVKRLYSITTPWHELFELPNAEARNVPEDPANFHLSQINS